jgi:hypothetical protein
MTILSEYIRQKRIKPLFMRVYALFYYGACRGGEKILRICKEKLDLALDFFFKNDIIPERCTTERGFRR